MFLQSARKRGVIDSAFVLVYSVTVLTLFTVALASVIDPLKCFAEDWEQTFRQFLVARYVSHHQLVLALATAHRFPALAVRQREFQTELLVCFTVDVIGNVRVGFVNSILLNKGKRERVFIERYEERVELEYITVTATVRQLDYFLAFALEERLTRMLRPTSVRADQIDEFVNVTFLESRCRHSIYGAC